ncbi:MAG: LamG domain-containing protein [Sedimentisphaerales bacterium]|nr:LamG domain-containing protein [Sedimentisphaerales bacterium]
MSKKTVWLLSFALALGLISTGYGDVVFDFETGAQGWSGLKDGTAPTVSSETHSAGGSQSLRVTIDEAAHDQQEAGWASPRDFTADQAAGGLDTLSFWYRVDDPDLDGGNFVFHWIMSTEAWSGGGWYGNGLWGVVVADGQWHEQTADLTILGEAAGGWQGTWGDQAAWDFRDDLFYSFEIAVASTDNTSGSDIYIDDVKFLGAAAPPSEAILVSDFEGGLDGWYTDTWTAGTIALSTTGATEGAEAMQVEGPGGWQQMTKVDAKPHLAALATPGVAVSVDVTAFPADMTTTWMEVGMVINSTDDVGWIDLGLQGITLDGQPQTLTWAIPQDATDKIATADDTIGWFELLLISNVDEASTVKFYVDNVQIVGVPVAAGKNTDFILGNWEQDLDRWVVGATADVRYSDTNGVTLDTYSLDVYTPTGEWANALTMNLLEPNNADVLAAFRANTKATVDITHLVVDWPVGDIPPWNGTHLIINTDAAAVPTHAAANDGSGYVNLGYRAGWNQNEGDRTDSVTWDYSQHIREINANFDKVTYLELLIVVNANSAEYGGWVWFYLDNMMLSGGGIPLNPQPANGAKDINIETLLGWDAGMFAGSHNLYLGTSRGAVAAAEGDSDPDVLFVSLDGSSFDPNDLEFNTQYFWRIDAVNDVNPDSPWVGAIWEFTTGNFLVVDDFESYTNESPDRVFQTWVDGYGFSEDEWYPVGNPGNGSDAAVGHDIWSPFTPYATLMETETVHGGSQAMPLYYDNQTAGFSEATRTWTEPQDWTINNFNALMLFIYGQAGNVADPLYVTLTDDAGNSATVTYDDPAVFTNEEWFWWQIPVADFAGVDMASIKTMAIGVGSKTAVSGADGMLLIDDVRVGVQPIGLVAHYELEGDLADSSGNGHDGVFGGDPNFPASYVAGPAGLGQAMLFDGTGGHQNVELGTFNPSAATGQLTVALWAKWNGLSDQWQGLIGKRDSWAVDDMLWDIEANLDTGTIGFRRIDSYPDSGGRVLPIGVWTHIAATFDGTTARFYIDGEETGNGAFSFGLDKEAALHFGSGDPNGGNAFNGAIDDVRLYDIALSADEVNALAGN